MTPILLQTVASAAEVSTDSLTTWVVGAVMAAVMAALGFLVRNAFGKVESTLEVVVKKLDTMTEAFARADGDRRVLEAELRALTKRVDALEERVREASEGLVR